MYDSPTERTTLLAKHSRRQKTGNSSETDAASETHSTGSSSAADAEASTADRGSTQDEEDEEEYGLQFSWSSLQFYLVEPMVLILVFAYNLSATIMKNQVIYQTCTAIFQYNETDCKLLGTKNTSDHIKDIETAVQPYAARIFMTTSLIQAIIPALCGAFIGAWSDRFGRRPLFIAAFAGYALYYVFATIISYVASDALVSPWFYLLAELPNALLGGGVTYSVATFCYISDVSSARERPYRMAFYEAVIYIGLMTGSFASGFIYEASSATVVFAISAGSILFALYLIILLVPESLNLRNNAAPSPECRADIPRANMEGDSLWQIFDLKLFREMWKTCFKTREFNDRAIIWLTIATLLTSVFVVDGGMTVFYLFIREKFHWTVKEFTTYETVSILVPIVGNLFGIWLLRKWLKMSVISLGILAFVSQSAGSLLKGFAFASWHIYLAIFLGVFKSIGNPMCRTIITNLVPASELGKIFSFLGVLQSMMPFLASPVYTVVYSVTLTSFPGFFNVLSANLFLLAIAFLLTILRKKQFYSEHYQTILS